MDLAFHSLLADRLAFLCGAGLSMAPPSNLPSAAVLAASIQAKYNGSVPGNPLTDNIEEQATYFWNRHELAPIFIRTLIDRHIFAGRPNAAHFAVADFLLTNAADFAVSANVDGMIEMAGATLLGMIDAGTTAGEMAAAAAGTAPLLKIHGCWARDRDNTLWTPEQLTAPPLQTRVPDAADWARNRLMNRDILVVGFFTDWDYLNTILADALDAVQPANLIVVDPDEPANLELKAPNLYAVGQTAAHQFCHVQEYGDVFLRRLRVHFSQMFIRRTLHGGSAAFATCKGAPPPPDLLEPGESEPDALWRLRRDIQGCRPNQPATLREPPDEPELGLTILELLSAGATWKEALFQLGQEKIRVLRSGGQFLHELESIFAKDDAPVIAPDAVIAVGAAALGLAAHIARPTGASSIARGAKPHWFDRAGAETEYHL